MVIGAIVKEATPRTARGPVSRPLRIPSSFSGPSSVRTYHCAHAIASSPSACEERTSTHSPAPGMKMIPVPRRGAWPGQLTSEAV